MNTDRLNNGRMILNYDRINVLEIEASADRLEVLFHYRPKLKLEKIRVQKEFKTQTEMDAFFMTKGLFRLENYYINPKNIALAIEDNLNDATKKLDVSLFFNDGAPFETHIPRDLWNAFKNYRLV